MRREWDLIGALILEREMKEGQPSGLSRERHLSGRLKLQSTYAAGSLTGVKSAEGRYLEGKLIALTRWDPDGKELP